MNILLWYQTGDPIFIPTIVFNRKRLKIYEMFENAWNILRNDEIISQKGNRF